MALCVRAAQIGQPPSNSSAGLQQGKPARGGRGIPPTAVHSPEVHSDHTVIFSLPAPRATEVDLIGEVLQGKTPMPMTKGEDGVFLYRAESTSS